MEAWLVRRNQLHYACNSWGWRCVEVVEDPERVVTNIRLLLENALPPHVAEALAAKIATDPTPRAYKVFSGVVRDWGRGCVEREALALTPGPALVFRERPCVGSGGPPTGLSPR